MGLMMDRETHTIRELSQTGYYSIPTPPLTRFDREPIRGIGNIFTAFGNHEAKALTMVALAQRGEATTKHELRTALLRSTQNAWDLHADSVEGYLKTLRRFGGLVEAIPYKKGL